MIKQYREPVARDRGRDLSKPWYVEFYCKNPATKKWQRFQYKNGINFYGTKSLRLKELKAWRDSYSDLLYSGWTPFSPEGLGLNGLAANKLPVPLEAALDAVLQVKIKERKSEETIRSYKSIYKIFADYSRKSLKNCFADMALITKYEMRGYSQYMLGQGYSSKSHNNHLSMLSNFFKECIFLDYIEANPCTAVKLMPEDKGGSKTNIAFDQATRNKIVAYLEKHDQELLIFQKCIYYLAIRPKELRLMRIGFIDLERKIVTIPAYERGDKIAKTGQTKIIGIPEAFCEELISVCQRQTEDVAPGVIPEDLFLFSPGTGKFPYSKDVMNRRFAKVKKALNLPKGFTNYGWKHTAADALFDSPDIADTSIQQHYRHSSLAQTQEYARNRGKRLNADITEHYPKF